MKTNYICEHCGTIYTTDEAALKCEEMHVKEEEKRTKEAQEKEERSRAISNLINLYIKRYGEMPNVEISGENHTALARQAYDLLNLGPILNELFR